MLNVAIQGGPASFHDIASHEFFDGKELNLHSCNTFRGVFEKLENEDVEFALVAIENSIAGSILENYSLLEEFGHFVCGEYKLRIKQNLMALPGQKIEDLKEVKSHYMALLQCKEYFSSYPTISLVKYVDTADSAKLIRDKKLKGIGAIASFRAAELYGLELLAESIETIKLNFTRFLVISKEKQFLYPKREINSATLSFELPHRVGALADALKVIVDNGVNLTKIQSVPIIGRPDNYTFYIDCSWNNDSNILNCYRGLKQIISKMTILGEYKKHHLNL